MHSRLDVRIVSFQLLPNKRYAANNTTSALFGKIKWAEFAGSLSRVKHSTHTHTKSSPATLSYVCSPNDYCVMLCIPHIKLALTSTGTVISYGLASFVLCLKKSFLKLLSAWLACIFLHSTQTSHLLHPLTQSGRNIVEHEFIPDSAQQH